MLEVMQEDYIRTARSKGLKKWGVIYKHGLKNALIPVITVVGMSIPFWSAALLLRNRYLAGRESDL